MRQLGEDNQFKSDGNVPPVLILYANPSFLFVRFHAKVIPWGHISKDFLELDFSQGNGEEVDDEDDEHLYNT